MLQAVSGLLPPARGCSKKGVQVFRKTHHRHVGSPRKQGDYSESPAVWLSMQHTDSALTAQCAQTPWSQRKPDRAAERAAKYIPLAVNSHYY